MEMKRSEAFHEGERRAQERAGEVAVAELNAPMIAGTLSPGPRRFLAEQRLVVAATADAGGAMWASPLFGESGLASSADGREVAIDLNRVARTPGDPFWANLRRDSDLGLLAIDLGTRRRLRINLRTTEVSEHSIRGRVREAYPNCPKYIQRRRLRAASDPGPVGVGLRRGTALDAAGRELIGRSDTLFVASRHPERGADASHRGGSAGFAKTLDARTLRVPDYAGNGLFNTLGNFLVDPRAGLAFLDFERGRVLQVTGSAVVNFGVPEARRGAEVGERSWDFTVDRWVEWAMPGGWIWEFIDASPFNPPPSGGGSPGAPACPLP